MSKISQNLPSKWTKKQVDFENLEGGEQRSKKEGLWTKHRKKIPKTTWTSLNLKITSPYRTYLRKASIKKEKMKKIEPKRTSRILMPPWKQ
jgi:hypothetical protein